jgi:hypothetical protein
MGGPDRRGGRPAWGRPTLVVLDQRGDCPAWGRPALVAPDRRGGRPVIMAPNRWLPSINGTLSMIAHPACGRETKGGFPINRSRLAI